MNHPRHSLSIAITILLAVSILSLPSASAFAQEGGNPLRKHNGASTAPSGAATTLSVLPASGGPGANLIQDASFEAYTPNPYWAESSTNFGTPLCSLDCGTGGGTGPHSGSVWAWFGGTYGTEIGSLSQTVTIPTGEEATFTFWVEQPVCDLTGAVDYMRVMVDAVEVWRTDASDPFCGSQGYRQITLDFTAFANGADHTIQFDSRTDASSGVTNFFVDDVSLVMKIYQVYMPLIIR